jgi:CrcB protein
MTVSREQAGWRDLALVAGGAIPGALLRWRLDQLVQAQVIPLPTWCDTSLIANLSGCLLIGLLVARPRHPGLFLWAGIGFCGALTTFSGWMLQVSLALRSGRSVEALPMLLLPVVAGLFCTALGSSLKGRR